MLIPKDERLELYMLFLPSLPQLLKPSEPVATSCAIASKAASVYPGEAPGCADLERDDLVGRSREELPVMRDEENRFRRVA